MIRSDDVVVALSYSGETDELLHLLETIRQVVNDEPVPPTKLMPRLPKDINTICLKCLSKDPKKRYSSVAELDADVQRFLHDEPIQARPIAWWERTWPTTLLRCFCPSPAASRPRCENVAGMRASGSGCVTGS